MLHSQQHEVTVTFDLWPLKSNQFLFESKCEEIPERQTWDIMFKRPWMCSVTLTFDLWPPESNGFLCLSEWTLGPNLKGFSWGVFNKKGIYQGEGHMVTFCMNVVFSDLILTDLIFSLITDSVVVTSQRLTVKSWPQLWSQTPHIWENWIWVETGSCRTQQWSCRTQEWSCCVLDWRVQTVDWRLWGP